MAWTPFGLSWADAMQDAGTQGQQAGQQIVGGFQFPLNSGSGVMTLNPGTGQQSSINVSTLFPDSGNTNSTTANITSLYGNDTSTLATGLDASNLLAPFIAARKAWSTSFTLDQIPKGSYLCVARVGSTARKGPMLV